MKTSEFIKKVDELGYKMIDEVDDMVIYHDDKIMGSVNNNKVNKLDTSWYEDISTELLDLCVEYAKTPIEERKEEKKYYLRLPIKGDPNISYLNYDEIIGGYSFNSNVETPIFKTQFTQKEIDELPNQDFIRTLIKEEVECQI